MTLRVRKRLPDLVVLVYPAMALFGLPGPWVVVRLLDNDQDIFDVL